MKKLLFPLFIALTLFSCTSKESKMNKSIENSILKTLNDPSSYEFVESNIVKTISVSDRKKSMTKEKVDKVKRLNSELPSPELLFQVETEYEFLLKQKDDIKDAVYYVDFKIRANNKMGGKVMETFSATVLNDNKYTVVYLKQK